MKTFIFGSPLCIACITSPLRVVSCCQCLQRHIGCSSVHPNALRHNTSNVQIQIKIAILKGLQRHPNALRRIIPPPGKKEWSQIGINLYLYLWIVFISVFSFTSVFLNKFVNCICICIYTHICICNVFVFVEIQRGRRSAACRYVLITVQLNIPAPGLPLPKPPGKMATQIYSPDA